MLPLTPGAQTQTDWAVYPRVDVGDGLEHLSAFVMSLSHSRMPAVIWLRNKNQLSWLQSHNESYRHREERRVRTSFQLSGLPTGMTMGNFDFAFQPGIEKSRIETLATCSWIREHETVLLQGPSGISKTHLAVAPGVNAVENGFSVAFYRFDDLLHAMKKDADVPPRRLRGKKYMKVALLAVDEVGFQMLDRQEASLFLRLVSYLYQKGGMIITTNKAIKDWSEVMAGDEVMTTALLYRLLHRCHVLNIKGRSHRLRDQERALK